MKLILDTDIGTDVDDVYALAFALAAKEFDLIAVSTVHGNVELRARIAAKLLALAGRKDVPVYMGMRETMNGKRRIHWPGHEGKGVDLSGIDGITIEDNAVDRIIELAKKYGRDLVIATIGPLTNLGMAFQKAPEIMCGINRLYIMGGEYHGVGLEVARPDHNTHVDSEAAAAVLAASVPTTIVGQDVTCRVFLTADQVEIMRGNPVGDYLAALTDVWFECIGQQRCNMHDPLAVSTICDPSFVRTESYFTEMVVDPGDQSKVVYLRDGEPKKNVAVDVDSRRFERFFISRIYSLMPSVNQG